MMSTHNHTVSTAIKALSLGETYVAPWVVALGKDGKRPTKSAIIRYHNGPAYQMTPTEAGLEFKRVR